MARPSYTSKSARGGAWKFVGAAAVAIVGGIGIGYLFGGARTPRPPEQPVPLSATVLTPPAAPSVSPSSIRPQTTNGNYTAPNAPRITIHEEDAPILRRATPPPAAPVDTEASQEAAPTPAPSRRTTTDASSNTAPDTGTPTPPDGGTATTPTNSGPAAPDTSKTMLPDSSKPTVKPPANADPDIEQVTPRGASAPASVPPTSSASRAQFRVQTGAYADEGNARTVADQLRSQGYTTSTRSERDGDHLVYKVQVGAYRSHSGASKAADDLQKKGVPVYVSPIGP